MRLCLSLAIIPVFAPPRETGFQAAIENFNGRWQAKVWARITHESLAGVQAQAGKFIAAKPPACGRADRGGPSTAVGVDRSEARGRSPGPL
ncbi:MAG: hypothetical protein JO329_22290 [Planctomycetaceae bacterium]|nr:hypothetical protein [Planctomycetaceae bacterium]